MESGEDSIASASQPQFAVIPDEVLEEVFQFVSNEDRRNIRLVCKRWFGICNRLKFLQNETFVCNKFTHCTKQIFATLQKSKRKLFRLRFHSIPFSLNDVQQFRILSSKILSLEFIYCCFEAEVIENVIITCHNLLQLSIRFDSTESSHRFQFLAEYLTRKNVVKSQVTFLEIEFPERKWLNSITVKQIFCIFPNLQHFKIIYADVKQEVEDILPNLRTGIRSLENHIEGLHLDFRYQNLPHVFLDEIFTDLASFRRLVEFSLKFTGDINEVIIKKLSPLQRLQTLNVEVGDIRPSLTEFLIYIASTLPNLRHVYISSSSEISITSELFTQLVMSKWKTFHIQETVITCDQDFVIDESLRPNLALRSLKLYYEDCQPNVMMPFIKYFLNLEHLEMHNISNEVMFGINKYQTKLKSLILYDCKYCTDHGFTGLKNLSNSSDNEVYSIRRLKDLEHLEIRAWSCKESCLTKKTFAEFDFPNLKYLLMRIKFEPNDDDTYTADTNETNEERILTAIEKLPNLEAASLYYEEEATFNFWSTLCSRLKRLRYLHIDIFAADLKMSNIIKTYLDFVHHYEPCFMIIILKCFGFLVLKTELRSKWDKECVKVMITIPFLAQKLGISASIENFDFISAIASFRINRKYDN